MAQFLRSLVCFEIVFDFFLSIAPDMLYFRL
jgi:hypothetical protein